MSLRDVHIDKGRPLSTDVLVISVEKKIPSSTLPGQGGKNLDAITDVQLSFFKHIAQQEKVFFFNFGDFFKCLFFPFLF